ncbi:MAG: agmatine deiminase family protein [Gammaproteobacteria bacterium]|nr:agmatine deiminase family protein [Gammaproteobacteria bacterium]
MYGIIFLSVICLNGILKNRRLVPEWAEQKAVLLVWPHAESDFKDDLPALARIYSDLAYWITQYEMAWIICFDEVHQHAVQNCLEKRGVHLSRCQFFQIPTNDIWVRDFGPLCAQTSDGEEFWLCFQFNGWGGKYPYTLDNQVSLKLSQELKIKNTQFISFILEGGGIETDGEGSLLATSSSILNPNRNGALSQKEVEAILSRTLGVNRILWLNEGFLQNDDTDGHIDNLARFCNKTTLCYTACQNPKDEHFRALALMEQALRAGVPQYHLIPLPLPHLQINGQRLPASYANFLIIQNAVLVPLFNLPTDQIALAQITKAFPTRKVIGIECTALLKQYGGLHCATRQLHFMR